MRLSGWVRQIPAGLSHFLADLSRKMSRFCHPFCPLSRERVAPYNTWQLLIRMGLVEFLN
jgi:hypothetical protein